MHNQTTIAQKISYTGIGLHSGQNVTMTLNPATAETGIVFVRTDLPDRPGVKASASYVTNAQRATTLEGGAARVFTVEHLLAAFSALEVDNCLVELDAAEPPVGDGSSLTFVNLLQQAGRLELAAPRRVIAVDREYSIRVEDKFIALLPYDGLRISFTSVNPHPELGVQFGDYEINPDTFIREIAPARTIGFMHEIKSLQEQGLALGGSMDNALVYENGKPLNPLRFSDELVRHKILDVIGDLSLAGIVRGHVIAVKSGHALNTALAKKILEASRPSTLKL
ncbi:UDP-3-O-[3-hydroxymyristoyl] N-acetylglucosamine deacetylase [Propionispora sp. 2/2-37]|uniref:UDP-3-O-acyl-N-acetylglucosamine deacetylase n=1 Tax=Propionispora sp. 2/2-37 TaxID=1677858 RepID=UPI0006BB5837|nr:UDP-3-O-acyl-N-acetylglucosamine deacetylase [Propionispora sp. 2/2-37]CUH94536.1 UDP-3-O-[3-hydroxymyristoyl] N-acetylglucosamine deacetylase [Propionispora sp. 2/2-37]